MNPATEALHNEEILDEKVEFSDNGTVNVPRDVGIALVENYDSIVKYNADEEEDSSEE